VVVEKQLAINQMGQFIRLEGISSRSCSFWYLENLAVVLFQSVFLMTIRIQSSGYNSCKLLLTAGHKNVIGFAQATVQHWFQLFRC